MYQQVVPIKIGIKKNLFSVNKQPYIYICFVCLLTLLAKALASALMLESFPFLSQFFTCLVLRPAYSCYIIKAIICFVFNNNYYL